MDEYTRDIIERLKPHAKEYLATNGYTFDGKGLCTCPSPEHDDKNPSFGIVTGSDGKILHCLGCQVSYTIFHLANLFHDYPLHGKEFYTQTLVHLCETFNISYEPPVLTEHDIYLHRVHTVYRDAVRALLSFPVSDRVRMRGWTQDTCISTMTGSVPDWPTFKDKMRGYGYKASVLDEMDINKKIFNEHTIVFTWCNEWGEPIGFSGRDIRYKDEDPDKPRNLSKYHNTAAKVPIFQKGTVLYGLNSAKTHRPLMIVEGYPDVVTAHQNGQKNLVCLGGTAFTDGHLRLLRRLGIDDVVLALNPDEAGTKAVVTCLDEGLSGKSGIYVRVLDVGKQLQEM